MDKFATIYLRFQEIPNFEGFFGHDLSLIANRDPAKMSTLMLDVAVPRGGAKLLRVDERSKKHTQVRLKFGNTKFAAHIILVPILISTSACISMSEKRDTTNFFEQ